MRMTIPQETLQELTYLRNRVSDLEYLLKTKVAPISEPASVIVARHFGITVAKAKIIILMSSGRAYTREQIMDAYSNGEAFYLRNVDSQVKRIRRDTTIRFNSLYGYGYELTAESAREVRAVIDGKCPP